MDRAIGLMASLLKEFEDQTSQITLVPSDGGRFEVTLDGALLDSKLQTGRHAEEGEIARLIRERP
jgi:selenoprotein W-related protein